MNVELQETLELARTLDKIITFSEHHVASDPVRRAAARIRSCICDALFLSVHQLNYPPLAAEEFKRISESLDKGEIPKSTSAIGDFLPKLIDDQLTQLEAGIAKQRGRRKAEAA